MIQKLIIRNFKSMKYVYLECKKINIFIGEPNTGKSNILETIGIYSYHWYGRRGEYPLKDFVRFETISSLFYDGNSVNPINLQINDNVLEISYKEGLFEFNYHKDSREQFDKLGKLRNDGHGSTNWERFFSPYKYYKFKILDTFRLLDADFLIPPYGENLLTVIMTNKELKREIKEVFDSFNLKLSFKPHENKIEILKEMEDTFVTYPYSVISDTIQRINFYLTVLYSNKDSVIAFEEPESHAFPYYVTHLAERIALDKNNNQFFITTHNPYLLHSILEKAPKNKINVFITYLENFETKIKSLDEQEMKQLLDTEMYGFFNIESFLEREN
ncbi:MAG: AAA family ATPase [Candidatus Helarchaeota archaeon]